MYRTKQPIRLTESQLRQIVNESVKRVVKESRDSVETQPFDGDSTYFSSEEDIRKGEENERKYHPWRSCLNNKEIEEINTKDLKHMVFMVSEYFETYIHSIQDAKRFISDLYDLMCDSNF